MAEITNLRTFPVVPSDVFGWEANTDVGYARETFTLTLTTGQTAQVGSVLKLDYATRTATLAAAPADAAAVTALGTVGVFVGRDTPVNPAVEADFDRLTVSTTGQKVVVIIRGDGRGTLYKKYLDFAGTKFYTLAAAAQTALISKFTLENRFKVLDQV